MNSERALTRPRHLKVSDTRDGLLLQLRGNWRLAQLVQIRNELESVSIDPQRKVIVDGSELQELDTAGAMVLCQLLLCRSVSDRQLSFENFPADYLSILKLVRKNVQTAEDLGNPESLNYVESVGHATTEAFQKFKHFLSFLGEVIVDGGASLARPKQFRTKEFFVQLETVCINALPVVCLVTFLIGVVVAYLFAEQLQKYGANIFIVDGVSIAMFRELSPIIVAIIIAGRSGSAFTAQIGTMKLNQEIDAMQTLGLSPMLVLVLPRLLALMVAMPLLVFIGDIVGVIGGMIIADVQLGVTAATFIDRLQAAIAARHIFVGLIKAPVFAAFIAIIGCRMGLVVENNARSVGINTTSTVVQSIVSVILLNAGFAVIFVKLHY